MGSENRAQKKTPAPKLKIMQRVDIKICKYFSMIDQVGIYFLRL